MEWRVLRIADTEISRERPARRLRPDGLHQEPKENTKYRICWNESSKPTSPLPGSHDTQAQTFENDVGEVIELSGAWRRELAYAASRHP